MKADKKEYRCGVCSETLFENIQTSPGFACANCQTHFRRDRLGIKIEREPTDDWKKRNKTSWDSVKEIFSTGKYIEFFTR